MKIESYTVQAGAQRSYTRLETQSLELSLWGRGGADGRAKGEAGDRVSLSDWAQQMLADKRTGSAGATGELDPADNAPKTKEELKMKMLETFVYSLTGRHINTRVMDAAARQRPMYRKLVPLQSALRGAALGGQIKASSVQYEHEAVAYQAQGVIKTADGKSISVDVSMSMSRSFLSYTSTTLQFAANPVDPLVINYGGTAASLSGENFAFDLDFDGTLDNISFAGPGSGFLALDKNGDGIINDGSELFGPGTGSGFGELRTHDKDGNCWIDENDDVFSKLLVWSRDADGKDQLFSLAQLGIGAIYLGDVATQFSMKDAENNTQGIMRSTSFFLRENGGAGTISHIDLMA